MIRVCNDGSVGLLNTVRIRTFGGCGREFIQRSRYTLSCKRFLKVETIRVFTRLHIGKSDRSFDASESGFDENNLVHKLRWGRGDSGAIDRRSMMVDRMDSVISIPKKIVSQWIHPQSSTEPPPRIRSPKLTLKQIGAVSDNIIPEIGSEGSWFGDARYSGGRNGSEILGRIELPPVVRKVGQMKPPR